MDNEDIINFAKELGKLKKIKRTGWKTRGIKDPESIADHSFRTAVLGMLLSDLEGLDTEKVVRMLLLHDIQEAVSGDITSVEKEKMPDNGRSIEEDSIRKILSYLPEKLKEKYLSLWEEMENSKTREAKFCKDMDKLEMMIQLTEYEKEQPEREDILKIFWEREDLNTPKHTDSLIKLYKDLKNEES